MFRFYLTYTQRIQQQCKGFIKKTSRLEKEKGAYAPLAGLSTGQSLFGG
jgi:hypothetical protein